MSKYNIKLSSLALLTSFFIVSACSNSTNSRYADENAKNDYRIDKEKENHNLSTNNNNDSSKKKMDYFLGKIKELNEKNDAFNIAKNDFLSLSEEDSSDELEKCIKQLINAHNEYCEAAKLAITSGSKDRYEEWKNSLLNNNKNDYKNNLKIPRTFDDFKKNIEQKYNIKTIFPDEKLSTSFNCIWKVLEKNKTNENPFYNKIFFRDYGFEKAPDVAQENSHEILDLNNEDVLKKIIIVDHSKLNWFNRKIKPFSDKWDAFVKKFSFAKKYRNTKFLEGEKGLVYTVLEYIKETNNQINTSFFNNKPLRVMYINKDGSLELSVIKLNSAARIDKIDLQEFSNLYYIYYNGEKGGNTGWIKVCTKS